MLCLQSEIRAMKFQISCWLLYLLFKEILLLSFQTSFILSFSLTVEPGGDSLKSNKPLAESMLAAFSLTKTHLGPTVTKFWRRAFYF